MSSIKFDHFKHLTKPLEDFLRVTALRQFIGRVFFYASLPNTVFSFIFVLLLDESIASSSKHMTIELQERKPAHVYIQY